MTAKTPAKKARQPRQAFGAIRALPSGRTQASYVGEDGIRYNAPHTFDNKTDARGWLSTQQAQLHTGRWRANDASRATTAQRSRTDTVEAYAVEWLQTRMNRHGEPLRPRTRVEYQRLLDTILTPLTAQRLNALTPAMIRKWNSEARTHGVTQAARAYGLLKAVLNTAVDDGKLTSNPCVIRGAQNGTTGRKVTPPTREQLQKILDTITPRYKAAVIIAAWAGCRFGEMTELRRKDVAVVTAVSGAQSVIVNVSRAVTQTTGEGFIVGKTKSEAGVRSIVLPPHVNQTVIDHLQADVATGPESLLFPAADGVSHLAQSTFTKHWYPAREAAERTDMPWHALRHHGATRAALAGATLKELQERLGHSTVAAAMRYQNTDGRDAELAQRMSDLAKA